MATYAEITDIFSNFGEELVKDVIASLKHKGHTPSGQSGLIGSIKYKVRSKDDNIEFIFSMADYWKYLDEGRRKGKRMPPPDALLDWMGRLNINGLKWYKQKLKNPAKTKVTFDKAQRSLAFAIAKNIGKKGTIKRFGYHGSHFLTEVLDDGRIKSLEEDLSKALKKDIEITLYKEVIAKI